MNPGSLTIKPIFLIVTQLFQGELGLNPPPFFLLPKMTLQRQSQPGESRDLHKKPEAVTHPEIHTTVSMTVLGSFPQRHFYPGVMTGERLARCAWGAMCGTSTLVGSRSQASVRSWVWRAGPWGGSDWYYPEYLSGQSENQSFEDDFHLNHPTIQLLPHDKHCPRPWVYSSEQNTDILVGNIDKKQASGELLRENNEPEIGVRLTEPLSQSTAVSKGLWSPSDPRHCARQGGTPASRSCPCPQ